jgi:hypothetical protein
MHSLIKCLRLSLAVALPCATRELSLLCVLCETTVLALHYTPVPRPLTCCQHWFPSRQVPRGGAKAERQVLETCMDLLVEPSRLINAPWLGAHCLCAKLMWKPLTAQPFSHPPQVSQIWPSSLKQLIFTESVDTGQ